MAITLHVPSQHDSPIALPGKEITLKHRALRIFAFRTGLLNIKTEWLDELSCAKSQTCCGIKVDEHIIHDFIGRTFNSGMELHLQSRAHPRRDTASPSNLNARQLKVLFHFRRIRSSRQASGEPALKKYL